MTLAEEIVSSGKTIAGATEKELIEVISGEIGRFVGWPYKIRTGRIVDSEGNVAEPSGIVVCVGSENNTDTISADRTAAVIEVVESLDLETLRASYRRLAAAKKLKKSPPPQTKDALLTTVTIGIVLAKSSAVPLEILAGELEQLNAKTSDRQWPEAIVINSVGSIQYGAQFPGEGISGGMLPPAEGALANYVPATYVVMTIMGSGDYALNRLLHFLFVHLSLFSPGSKLPNIDEILIGAPTTAITRNGYQYNLSGQLVPVPREYYNDRYLPQSPIVIEGPDKEPLASIRYIPWQDGAVIVMLGKLPLAGILIFLSPDIQRNANLTIVRRPHELQISLVLPITQQDFVDMINRFQQRSNMRIRKNEPNWIVQRISNEGSTSPFMARLYIGVLQIRNAVYNNEASKELFDKKYDSVIQLLISVRDGVRSIVDVWTAHSEKIRSGEIVKVTKHAIHIDEYIDKELKRLVDAFLNEAVRALKYGMQALCEELHADIGFLFKQPAAFQTGIAALQPTDPLLVAYLLDTRQWSERLLNVRNNMEHAGWSLPRIKYERTDSGVLTTEPMIENQPLTQFVAYMMDRLCCFVEEVTMHCLQRRMSPQITLSEIPLASRVTEAPERFVLTAAIGGMPHWTLASHASMFEET